MPSLPSNLYDSVFFTLKIIIQHFTTVKSYFILNYDNETYFFTTENYKIFYKKSWIIKNATGNGY